MRVIYRFSEIIAFQIFFLLNFSSLLHTSSNLFNTSFLFHFKVLFHNMYDEKSHKLMLAKKKV